MGWALMIVGLSLTLATSVMLILGILDSRFAIVLGIFGVGLIAFSGRWMKKANSKSGQVVRTIYSPDRQLRALIKQRDKTDFRIEVQKFVHDYSPDVGSHDRWERRSNVPATGVLSQVIEIAATEVGAGTDDFFEPKK